MDYTTLFSDCQAEILNRFSPKKEDSLKLADQYQRIYCNKNISVFLREKIYNRWFRVSECASFLEFSLTSDSKRLSKANFCKDRLCPMCSWRRSLKVFGQVSQIVDSLSSSYEFVFLTLTVRNVKADRLSSEIDKLFFIWREIRKSSFYKSSYYGDVRVLEVTYNSERNDYHPHLHIILAVDFQYFRGKNYKKHSDWLSFWQDSYGDPNITQVNIQSFLNREKGVAETAKYTIKYKDFPDHVVAVLFDSLFKRRLLSFSGCFYKERQKLKFDDAIDGDLVNVDNISNPELATVVLRFKWGVGVGYYSVNSGELVDNGFINFRPM